MALYTVRSERLFCEQRDYNMLYCWFLDMNMVEESFVPTVFPKILELTAPMATEARGSINIGIHLFFASGELRWRPTTILTEQ